jgi:ParB family chromosome partitioning protein
VGRERVTVTNALRLLKLPERAQQAVRTGKIQQGHAKALVGIPDDRVLLEVLDKVIEGNLSVRATERLVKTLGRPRGARPVEPALRRLSDQLTRDLGTRVQVKRGQGSRGRIVIDFHSTEHLNQLLDLLPQESR